MLDSIAMHEFLSEAVDALDEKAVFPPGAYWLIGNDEGVSYCLDCIRALVPTGEPGEDYMGGGDYEQDGSCICEKCGKLLQYTLTDYGVANELEHFVEIPFEWNDPDDCYELAQVAHGIYENETQSQKLFWALVTGENLPDELRKKLFTSLVIEQGVD